MKEEWGKFDSTSGGIGAFITIFSSRECLIFNLERPYQLFIVTILSETWSAMFRCNFIKEVEDKLCEESSCSRTIGVHQAVHRQRSVDSQIEAVMKHV